jgi:hypothetical protein
MIHCGPPEERVDVVVLEGRRQTWRNFNRQTGHSHLPHGCAT